MEQTLVLIKPDAMQGGKGGTIAGRLEKLGLKLVAVKMLHMDKALAERHYSVHRDKPFFENLVKYITSAPVIALVYEGENAVESIRKALGATDPAKSEPGTIRADFGTNIESNAVHGSDSPTTAEWEINYFYKKE